MLLRHWRCVSGSALPSNTKLSIGLVFPKPTRIRSLPVTGILLHNLLAMLSFAGYIDPSWLKLGSVPHWIRNFEGFGSESYSRGMFTFLDHPISSRLSSSPGIAFLHSITSYWFSFLLHTCLIIFTRSRSIYFECKSISERMWWESWSWNQHLLVTRLIMKTFSKTLTSASPASNLICILWSAFNVSGDNGKMQRRPGICLTHQLYQWYLLQTIFFSKVSVKLVLGSWEEVFAHFLSYFVTLL